ncbi:pectate lyase [Ferrimonas pelagia]|uniref:Right handed beta helix domain-containing protein n=1 Tax=Ferrimonas pelagia TaxID=1177826 RepID=A0ABP9EM15_9GAMM
MRHSHCFYALLLGSWLCLLPACSDRSSTPEEPVSPPTDPDPGEPIEPPTDPDNPGEPTDPTDPDVPVIPPDPGFPIDPDPGEPIEPPTDPDNPGEPVDPTDPDVPVTPPDPGTPIDPDPGEPIEPPTDPDNPGEPVDPTDPDVPVTPPESGDCDAMDPLPVIPCAIGFGMDTPAGSGRHEATPNATVYKVSNLNASGDGSLKACTDASGPRVCVFEISGIIDLTSVGTLDIMNPYITIAGQTAPSPGITLRGASIRWEAHDALIQHIRIRTGDAIEGRTPGDRDGIYVIGKGDDESRRPVNVVFDHISVSWGLDETFTVKDTARNVTVSNSIISEGLWYNMHPKGGHSKGLMISAPNMLVQGNLIAHVDDRAPLETSPSIITANNVTYNARQVAMRLSPLSNNEAHDGEVRTTTVIGNVRLEGNNQSQNHNAWVQIDEDRAGSKIYIDDNLCEDWGGEEWPCARTNSGFKPEFIATEPPLWLNGLQVLPASETLDFVLANAGARPKDRDGTDQRIIDDVRNREGITPNCIDAETILYPVFNVSGADNSMVKGDIPDCDGSKSTAYVGKIAEIFDGRGAGQARTVESYSCSSNTVTLNLESSWDTQPDSSSQVRLHIDCSNNLGGWPELKETTRKLELPNNYNEVTASGYTRLEVWLHSYYSQVQ